MHDDDSLEAHASGPTWMHIDQAGTPTTAPADDYLQRGFWARFGLFSRPVPAAAARDFCARERNFLSWIRLVVMMLVLACAMFLEIKMRTLDDVVGVFGGMLGAPSAGASVPAAPKQHVFARSISTMERVVPRAGYWNLGTIYIVTAFLGYFASVIDYYSCITELENEHIYMDECEGHTHPAVTLISALIIAVVLGTAVLMLVQRE